MSTKEYLEGLSYEQLLYAKERASEMIKEIEDQKKVVLWEVEGVAGSYYYFKEDDLSSARDKLIEEIQTEYYLTGRANHTNFACDHPRITKLCVRVGELEDYGL